ncbi:urea ABC transporter ATP-binding subunit UrtE [Vreelandella titanicae]|uniref:urea ABC transporter ATP-binding subunit UrtE n=1 Tax=Halomonadaceae TaxID=28256 RepID=UPI00059B11E3|nr:MULTISPECIES: urea ABC transporter ATP-binding subunit UrtE [Halomonas]KIN12780.1 urea ABC transporter ATP-binding protein [Halomonas sp. KHS3]MCD1586838.1 urea ABC transporter ATP-binding subunit UrtE [Halomonas sp. IOP_14]
MTTNNTHLLSVEGVTSGYGTTAVLQEVSLSVGRGEVVAVIGRNGVGKTTLMKTLIGLLKHRQGVIRFDGQDIGALESHQRARLGIGYIPQGREVFSRMTVWENLKVGEMLQQPGEGVDYERVYEFFPILRERANQRAGTFSGGQQQQLAIGRAMVGKPKLMLLDEPSEGIQPNIVKDISRNILKLNRELGVTVLLVEQNLDMIMTMAQRCYVMDKGQITHELATEQLRDRDAMRRILAV